MDYSEWYTKSGKFEGNNVLQGWVEKENQALKRGYDGLRLSGNTFWLAKRDWRNFTDYEKEVNSVIGKYRMIAICTYSLGKCGASEVIDVVSNHQFALVRREGEWVIIESSERKRAEEALRGGEEKYRTILETIEDGYYEVDITGNFTFFNDSLCRILGYTKDELMGMNNRQYMDKETAKKVYQMFNQVYTTGEPYKAFDWEIIRKDGTKRFHDSSVSLIRNKKGEKIGFRGVARDITKRKQAEKVLRESEERFKDLFDDAPVGYYEIDMEGRINRVNRTELEMLGYKLEEMLGRYVWEFFVEKEISKQMVIARLAGTIPSGKAYERTCLKKDGTTLPVLVYNRILRDESGRIIGIRSIHQDITERKRAEEEMAALQEQLRQSQKMEAVGQLAGGIAHDFNNLLTIIKGYSQLSLIQFKESDPLKVNIDEINKATDRAADLIRQLLAFSRRQTMEMRVLNLNALLRNLQKMLHRVIGENIELGGSEVGCTDPQGAGI